VCLTFCGNAIVNAPACMAGGELALAADESLTGVRQMLQTAAFCALSSAAFSLATPSLSCQSDHTRASTLPRKSRQPWQLGSSWRWRTQM